MEGETGILPVCREPRLPFRVASLRLSNRLSQLRFECETGCCIRQQRSGNRENFPQRNA